MNTYKRGSYDKRLFKSGKVCFTFQLQGAAVTETRALVRRPALEKSWMSARPNFELRLLGKRPRRHVIFSFRKDSASPSLAASWTIMHSDHRKSAMKPYEEARRTDPIGAQRGLGARTARTGIEPPGFTHTRRKILEDAHDSLCRLPSSFMERFCCAAFGM